MKYFLTSSSPLISLISLIANSIYSLAKSLNLFSKSISLKIFNIKFISSSFAFLELTIERIFSFCFKSQSSHPKIIGIVFLPSIISSPTGFPVILLSPKIPKISSTIWKDA